MQGKPALTARRNALAARAVIIQNIRQFFIKGGYLEVETPLRIPAPAPEAHIDAIPSGNWFLHTSPEICMKRMMASGYVRIFQICRCWRADERGSLHLPEFTMLEWYRSNADYRDLMNECEDLINSLLHGTNHNTPIITNGCGIRFDAPWERVTVSEAFQKYAGISMEKALEDDLFDILMVEKIEPRLGCDKPTFIYDYPASRGALARLRQDDPTTAERFELYVGGIELANAFSELTDAEEQHARFINETAYRASLDKTIYPLPERFLEELSHMPTSAGIALGIDRLVMVLLGASSIDEVVAFTPEEL